MKKITTWQQAFKIKGLDPKKMPDVSMLPAAYQKPLIAHYKLNVVAEVLNDEWKPDYSNSNQVKYTPWFLVETTSKKPSGSGLSYLNYGRWTTTTFCGVRLCYKDRATAEYAGKTFKKLYEDLFLMH